MINQAIIIPHNTWCREVNWKKYSPSELGFDRTNEFAMKRITASNSGTWSTKEYLPMGAVEDTNNTIMWQIEINGSWQWEISDIADMIYLKLSGPNEQENHWYKELKPGDEFQSVKACITVGESFDDCLRNMTKYRRVICEASFTNGKLPVIFNDCWSSVNLKPATDKSLPVIDKAASIGAECYVVDAGWYADGEWWDTVGEWQPIGWRFPNGIKEVFDYIKAKGMIPGIWLEIEVMGIDCPILNQFDDECFFMRHGKRVIDHGRYQLDFRNKKVREFATSVVDRVVVDYGVGYIKFDYNIDAGTGTEVSADSFGDGLMKHGLAYISWIDEIRAKYPELIIEHCSSGGMRMEYAMLSKHHLQSVTDQTDYRHLAVIASNAATALLPEQAAIWSFPKSDGDENNASYNMVNAMLTVIHLSGDILKFSDKQFDYVKQGVECYKKLREDICKAIPFYPIGLNNYEKGWAAVAYKADDTVYLAVWRMNCDTDTLFIPLTAGKKDILYPSDSKCLVTDTYNGINITMPDKYSAVILKLIGCKNF